MGCSVADVPKFMGSDFGTSPTVHAEVKHWRNVDRIPRRPRRPSILVDIRLNDANLSILADAWHRQLKISASEIERRLNSVEVEPAIVCPCSE